MTSNNCSPGAIQRWSRVAFCIESQTRHMSCLLAADGRFCLDWRRSRLCVSRHSVRFSMFARRFAVVLCSVTLVEQAFAVPSLAGSRSARVLKVMTACSGAGANSFLGNSQKNVAAGVGATVVGGEQNTVCDDSSTVAAGQANGLEAASDAGSLSLIGGGSANSASATESFIGAGASNTVSGSAAAIAGGTSNVLATSPNAFLGGGASNSISVGENTVIGGGEHNVMTSKQVENDDSRVIVGGYGNQLLFCSTCSTDVFVNWGFIGGGYENAGNLGSEVVSGGGGNVANGEQSAIPGGYHNLARGQWSFAAGYGSYAVGASSFVWSDYSPSSGHLTASNAAQFLVRASGGTTFYSNASATTGVTLDYVRISV